MADRTSHGRAHRPRWALPAAITGGSLVVVIAAVTIINLTIGNRPSDPTAAGTGTPTSTPAPEPGTAGDGDTFSVIAGCLAGADITAEQLAAIRAQKNIDPAGAAEFLGAFMQYAGAAAPERRDGWWDVIETMTSGTARSTYATAGNDQSAYGDDKTHSIDLSRSAVRLVDYDADHVILDLAAIVLTDGQPVRASEGLEKEYEGVGGRYTLTNTDGGWRVDDLDVSAPWVEATTQGVAFTGGC